MMQPNAENPAGYWEHLDINGLHNRLMASHRRNWATANPLPGQWMRDASLPGYRVELENIVASNFRGRGLWGWKEPQTCMLLPLWREVLGEAGTELACLLAVRSPVDVASSLMRRDGIAFQKAVGIWFYYNIAALTNASEVPLVVTSYERLTADWEPELRHCAEGLGLAWPGDDRPLRRAMEAFIDPGLRHNRSSADRLGELPVPVRELYQALLKAREEPSRHLKSLRTLGARLADDFSAYASFFDLSDSPEPPGRLERLLSRWARSIRKRLPRSKANVRA